MKTIPATQKKFSELAIGEAFLWQAYMDVFVKTGEASAASTAPPPKVVRCVDVDDPDMLCPVQAKHTIFDGRDGVLIDKCCEGKVKYVTVAESDAHPYAILAPVLVEAVLACKTCGRVLHTIQERPKHHESSASKQTNKQS